MANPDIRLQSNSPGGKGAAQPNSAAGKGGTTPGGAAVGQLFDSILTGFSSAGLTLPSPSGDRNFSGIDRNLSAGARILSNVEKQYNLKPGDDPTKRTDIPDADKKLIQQYRSTLSTGVTGLNRLFPQDVKTFNIKNTSGRSITYDQLPDWYRRFNQPSGAGSGVVNNSATGSGGKGSTAGGGGGGNTGAGAVGVGGGGNNGVGGGNAGASGGKGGQGSGQGSPGFNPSTPGGSTLTGTLNNFNAWYQANKDNPYMQAFGSAAIANYIATDLNNESLLSWMKRAGPEVFKQTKLFEDLRLANTKDLLATGYAAEGVLNAADNASREKIGDRQARAMEYASDKTVDVAEKNRLASNYGWDAQEDIQDEATRGVTYTADRNKEVGFEKTRGEIYGYDKNLEGVKYGYDSQERQIGLQGDQTLRLRADARGAIRTQGSRFYG